MGISGPTSSLSCWTICWNVKKISFYTPHSILQNTTYPGIRTLKFPCNTHIAIYSNCPEIFRFYFLWPVQEHYILKSHYRKFGMICLGRAVTNKFFPLHSLSIIITAKQNIFYREITIIIQFFSTYQRYFMSRCTSNCKFYISSNILSKIQYCIPIRTMNHSWIYQLLFFYHRYIIICADYPLIFRHPGCSSISCTHTRIYSFSVFHISIPYFTIV